MRAALSATSVASLTPTELNQLTYWKAELRMMVTTLTMRGRMIDWKIENSRRPRSCAPICSSWPL